MTTLLDTDGVVIPEDVIPEDKKVYDDLVGESKKFKDNESLARAKANSDNFIKRLEQELAVAREDITRLAADNQANKRLDEIKTLLTQKPPESPETPNHGHVRDEGAPITEDKLEQMLNQREVKRQREANISTVKQKLVEVYGRDFPVKVKEAATQLGVDTDFIDSVAAQNPKAFYKMLGIDDTSREERILESYSTPPRSSIVSEGFKPSGDRKNYAYYNKLRTEKPEVYGTVRVQQEEMKEALRQGEDFYK